MTYKSLTLIILIAWPMGSVAKRKNPSPGAAEQHVEGVIDLSNARDTDDPVQAEKAYQGALDHFETAYTIYLSKAHESLLLSGRTFRAQKRYDEALSIFDSLLDSPNEKVRELARKERTSLLKTLGEADWARLHLECGVSPIFVNLKPSAVIGENRAVAARLNQWTTCSGWADTTTLRPGTYTLLMRREPAGDGEVPYTTSRQLELGIGEKQKVLVHFEVAPRPIVNVFECGCGSGPKCRPVGDGYRSTEDFPK